MAEGFITAFGDVFPEKRNEINQTILDIKKRLGPPDSLKPEEINKLIIEEGKRINRNMKDALSESSINLGLSQKTIDMDSEIEQALGKAIQNLPPSGLAELSRIKRTGRKGFEELSASSTHSYLLRTHGSETLNATDIALVDKHYLDVMNTLPLDPNVRNRILQDYNGMTNVKERMHRAGDDIINIETMIRKNPALEISVNQLRAFKETNVFLTGIDLHGEFSHWDKESGRWKQYNTKTALQEVAENLESHEALDIEQKIFLMDSVDDIIQSSMESLGFSGEPGDIKQRLKDEQIIEMSGQLIRVFTRNKRANRG